MIKFLTLWVAILIFVFCASGYAADVDKKKSQAEYILVKSKCTPAVDLFQESSAAETQGPKVCSEDIDAGKYPIIQSRWKKIMDENPPYFRAYGYNCPADSLTIFCIRPSGADFKRKMPYMELVYIEGGCFQMGDFSGAGSADERPVHEVCLDDFDIGKYPVTQAQWKNIMGSNPSYFKKCGDKCPVENVTWKEIDMFIGRLNTQTGKAFRLPTEAEWEFAARSRDKDEKWSGTDDKDELYEYAWYLENSDYETHPVGLKKPNAAGLYDMTGNVWQWTKDWYKENYYAKSPKDNPEGAYKGKKYVLRGGSWFMAADDARLTVRYQGEPALRINDAGIRLVLPKRRD